MLPRRNGVSTDHHGAGKYIGIAHALQIGADFLKAFLLGHRNRGSSEAALNRDDLVRRPRFYPDLGHLHIPGQSVADDSHDRALRTNGRAHEIEAVAAIEPREAAMVIISSTGVLTVFASR